MRNAGSLSYSKILIYAPDVIRNEYGEQVQEYSKVYETGASYEFVSGNSENQNGNIVSTYEVKFTVRQYVPIKENYIIYWNNEKYKVIYINHRQTYMDKQIKCTKVIE